MSGQTEENRAEAPANGYSAAALAYFGDVILELLTRERLVRSGISDAGKLNAAALSYVRAPKQSEAVDRIAPLLTEEEEALYRRGRNMGGGAHPKGATVQEYRRATGLEALFGGLWLDGREDRARVLFAAAFPQAGEKEDLN